jgi:hypothetical protein
LDWLFCDDWWHTSGITLRRDFLTRYGSFRPDLPVAEDTELWMRIAASGAIQCCQQEQPVATVRRHQQGHSWDGYSAAKSTRFYRKALLAALGSIRNHPQLYAPAAVETLRSRYRKAVEDDLSMLAGLPSLKEVARLVLEASAQQPGALWNRRQSPELAALALRASLAVQPSCCTVGANEGDASTCSRASRSLSVIFVCIGQCLGPHIEQNSACL